MTVANKMEAKIDVSKVNSLERHKHLGYKFDYKGQVITAYPEVSAHLKVHMIYTVNGVPVHDTGIREEDKVLLSQLGDMLFEEKNLFVQTQRLWAREVLFTRKED